MAMHWFWYVIRMCFWSVASFVGAGKVADSTTNQYGKIGKSTSFGAPFPQSFGPTRKKQRRAHWNTKSAPQPWAQQALQRWWPAWLESHRHPESDGTKWSKLGTQHDLWIESSTEHGHCHSLGLGILRIPKLSSFFVGATTFSRLEPAASAGRACHGLPLRWLPSWRNTLW